MPDPTPPAPARPARRRRPFLVPRGERDPGSAGWGVLAWGIILGMSVLFVFLQMVAGGQPDPVAAASDVPPPPTMLEASAKLTVAAGTPAEQASAASVLGWFEAVPADRLRVAIVLHEIGQEDDALARVRALLAETRGDLIEDVRAVEAFMTRGPEALTERDRAALSERHGWFADLLFTHGLDASDPARAEILAEAHRSLVVQTVFSLALLAIGVLSVVLFIAAIVLLATGRIKCNNAPPAAGGTVFLETFALFMISLVIVDILAAIVEPLIGSAAFLVRWLCLLAVLWPLARGLSLKQTLARIGWTAGRNPVIELFWGLVGYVAMLPVVAVGIGLTLLSMLVWGLVSKGEPAGPPTHPLPDLIANGSTFQLVMIIILATVWAPVVEETFFRGAFYRHLRGRLGPILSGLFCSFVFAAIHPQGIFGIPALMGVAMCMSMLREWRGSIWAPVAAHAANNGFITLMTIVLLG